MTEDQLKRGDKLQHRIEALTRALNTEIKEEESVINRMPYGYGNTEIVAPLRYYQLQQAMWSEMMKDARAELARLKQEFEAL